MEDLDFFRWNACARVRLKQALEATDDIRVVLNAQKMDVLEIVHPKIEVFCMIHKDTPALGPVSRVSRQNHPRGVGLWEKFVVFN